MAPKSTVMPRYLYIIPPTCSYRMVLVRTGTGGRSDGQACWTGTNQYPSLPDS